MKAKYVPFTTVSGDPEGTIFERIGNGKTDPLTRRPVVPWAPLAVPANEIC